jgi:hypothetical protein
MLNPIHSEEVERMSSVALEESDVPLPVKSIVKVNGNGTDNGVKEGEIVVYALKICAVVIFLFNLIILTSDLYYAFNDTSCVGESPKGLYLSLKNYLMVSGFMGVLTILWVIVLALKFDGTELTFLGVRLVGLFMTLFCFTWNVLGGVVFWGTVYPEGHCSLQLSTYVYITLVIKIVANLYMISLK